MQAGTAPMTNAPTSDTGGFDRQTFTRLGGAGMVVGIASPVVGYYLLAGLVPATEDLATRLALGFRWMVFPALAVVIGFMAAGSARFSSGFADGTEPPTGSALNMHRRYLQNTLEQFAYFFVVQMALVTLLPATALHLTPILCVQFLLGRLLFWRGYLKNPAYRAFGLTLNHVNLLALAYVLYRVVAG